MKRNYGMWWRCLALVTLLCLGLSESVAANVEKIKYSKYLVYEGEVDGKEPSMHGRLRCIDPENKDVDVLCVEGDFSGGYVSNATVTSNGLKGLELEGSVAYSINAEDKQNTLLFLTFGSKRLSKLEHDYISVTGVMQAYVMVRELPVCMSINKKEKVWNITYGNRYNESEKFVGVVEQMPFPENVEQFDYTEKELRAVQCTMEICRDSIYSVDESCTYIFDDKSYLFGNKLTFGTGGAFTIDNNAWYGTHKFVDGTMVTRKTSGSEFVIEYNNGDKYEGTVECADLGKAFGRNGSKHSFTYLNGVYTSGKDREEWIDGESFTKRHERLLKSYDEDLVDSIEKKLLTPLQCDTIMTERIEAKKKAEEELKALQETTAVVEADPVDEAKNEQLFMRHWKAKKTVFMDGSVRYWNLASVPSSGGLTSNMFSGYLTLTMQTNGKACLVIRIGPSKAAYKLGNEQTVKAISVSTELSKQFVGRWTVDGMKILMNGQDIGLEFTADGKGVKYYDQVLSGVMKVNSK